MTQRDTGERILAAAARLFADHGYVGTTTSAIAAEAGVNEVTLFRRFGNKEGVLRALAGISAAARAEFPPPGVFVAGDLKATLRNLAATEIRDGLDSGGLVIRLAFESRTVPQVAAAIASNLPSNVERLRAFLQPFQDEGILRTDITTELISEAFFGLTSSLVMYRLAMGQRALPQDGQVDALAQELVELFWAGAGAAGTLAPPIDRKGRGECRRPGGT